MSAPSSSTRRHVLDLVVWCVSVGLVLTAVALAF